MKKITALIITGFLLFGLVLYFSMSEIVFSLERFQRKDGSVMGTTVSDGVAVTTAINETPVEENFLMEGDLDPSVYSVINLRFIGETYVVESSWIEDLLGNKTQLEDAKQYWVEFGQEKVPNLLQEVLPVEKYDLKNYQKNIHGIKKDEIKGFEYYDQESSPDVSVAEAVIHKIIEARLKENWGKQEYIQVQIKKHMGTNGEYTDGKYVELDHSKQIIYAWEDGELFKSWYASGFFDEYAVFGVFDLKNKSLDAWSPVVSKWMPYWMAFYWDTKQQAWFGIHELVYWYDADGNRLEESSDSIGLKKSGGCVRLDRGEMVELYEWAEVGIPFLIYE